MHPEVIGVPGLDGGVHGVGEADDDLLVRGVVGERSVEQPAGPEVLHPVDGEAHRHRRPRLLLRRRGGGQELLGPEADQDSVHGDEVHRGAAEEPGDERVGRLVVDLLRGTPSCRTLPPSMTAMRSPRPIASTWSCVT